MKAALGFIGGIAAQTLYFFFLAGAAFGLVVGVLLIIDSRRVLGWNERMSRWISTAEAVRPLDQPRDIKRLIYRGHRVAGLLVIAGSLYALDMLTFSFHTAGLARVFRDLANQGMLATAFEALRVFLIVGNAAALACGFVLAFRPSLLKGLERWADRSYGRPASAADRMHFQPDAWVAAHPRLAGTLVAAASAYILIALGFFVNN